MSPKRDSIQKPSFDDSDDGSGMTLLHEHMKDSSTARRRGLRASGWLLKLFLGAVALICSVSIVYTAACVHRLSSVAIADYGDCGQSETVEEAREKGCVFDPMSWIWVRPECYDAELVAEFMNSTDFSWHTEPKLKPETKLGMDVIFRGDHPKLFTQKDYHTVHCFVRLLPASSFLGNPGLTQLTPSQYMMKKMHKAILEHRPIDSYLTEWHHTNHCGMVMLNDILHEDTDCAAPKVCPTWVRATWTACRRY